MSRIHSLLPITLAILSALALPHSAVAKTNSPRQRVSFNENWKFYKVPTTTPTASTQKWRWKSGQDLGALTEDTSSPNWKDAASGDDVFQSNAGFAWFRLTLSPTKSAKAPLLNFSGVDDNATVYLDGKKIFSHEGWGQPFDVETGAAWKPGQPNQLAILVENTAGRGSVGTVSLETEGAPGEAFPTFKDKNWRKLNLPHDWGIEGPFDQDLPGETGKLPWSGIGWYRKHFSIPANQQGKRFMLEIDGAMSYSTVWLNGQNVGGHPYGYSSYQLDLTSALKVGAENVLAIRLNNPPESSRWYPGGGIYRNVWLTTTDPVRVAPWGTQITTPEITPEKATVDVGVTLEKPAGSGPVAVLADIFAQDATGHEIGKSLVHAELSGVPANQCRLKLALPNPHLWDLKSPTLYTLVTTLVQNGQVVDRYETPFGVRTIRWTVDNGFLLNGKRVPLNGVCQHHDLGALGSAINTRALERQIEILQEMGCNAIRTSHNPPAPELLELCDRKGMLVLDEFVDMWKIAKKPNGYSRVFDNWAETDLRSFIHRDRNHPCVIAWSTGNEVPEQGEASGIAVSQFLTDIVHSEDSTRPTTAADSDTRAGYNGFQKTSDVFGYNYKPWEYAKFRTANPTQPLFGTETSSAISSRGEYFFPVSNKQSEGHSDFQVSSYDLSAPGWATTPDREFRGQEENPFVAGEFVWTGFDYLGEPTPYNGDVTNLLNFHTPEDKAKAEKELQELGRLRVPSRSSYFGIVDLAGFKKDRFYLYQAHWRPDLPMAHILPHWNWPERVGQVTPVHVYTSGDEAELFLNGQSLGRKKKGQYEYRLRWDDVVYQPGELRVVAYKNGQKWAEDGVRTTEAPAQVTLQSDRQSISADGTDLSYVTVSIADKNGLTVPRSKNMLSFSLSGPGEIVATDNGDATDHTSFQSKTRQVFNGLALVIVRSKKGKSGNITLKASSPGLAPAVTVIKSR